MKFSAVLKRKIKKRETKKSSKKKIVVERALSPKLQAVHSLYNSNNERRHFSRQVGMSHN